jgi:DNA-binding NtrC family response regulator
MLEKRRQILHIDDDPLITRMTALRLKRHGFEVTTLNEPGEALATLRDGPWRVVLLDIDMPNTDGLRLLRQIKSMDAGIQVVMLTGIVGMSSVLDSLRWGAEACFFKPLEDELALVDALNDIFRKLERWWEALEELASQRRRPAESGRELIGTLETR